jgi:hypothetical protein
MDASFPGWRDPPVKGRTKAIRNYNAKARQGRDLFDNAVKAIAALAWFAGQDLESI